MRIHDITSGVQQDDPELSTILSPLRKGTRKVLPAICQEPILLSHSHSHFHRTPAAQLAGSQRERKPQFSKKELRPSLHSLASPRAEGVVGEEEHLNGLHLNGFYVSRDVLCT